MTDNYHIDNNPDVSLKDNVLPISKVDSYHTEGITRTYLKTHAAVLNTIIKDFIASDDYKEMIDSDKYYESQNVKITERQKLMMLYDEKEAVVDGRTIKEQYPYTAPDLSRANHKLAHGYLYELINQCKDYLVGNPVKTEYDSKIPQNVKDTIDDILYKYNDWGKYNQENVKNAQKYKVGWSRVVIDENTGNLKLLNVNSKQVIYFLNDYEELQCLIYLYTKVEYDDKGKKQEVKYAEVFDDTYKDVYVSRKGYKYSLEKEDVRLLTKITQFESAEVTTKDNKNGTKSVTFTPVVMEQEEILSWGRIPWIMWKYNDDNIDALKPIRCFIDIMDIDLSDLANNVDDIQDAIWILENYQGQSIKQFMEDLKIKKAINVGDGGKVESKTTEIPTEAREKLYDKCEKNIYRFGRGINFADRDNLGNATGVALKWSYGPLDEKSDDLEENGQVALNDLFNLIFTYLNVVGVYKNEYDSNDVKFIFDRSMITNEKEQVEMVGASIDYLSQKTALSHHPFVDDAEEEIKEIDSDEKELVEKGIDNYEDEEGAEDSESEDEEDKRQEGSNNSKETDKDVQK